MVLIVMCLDCLQPSLAPLVDFAREVAIIQRFCHVPSGTFVLFPVLKHLPLALVVIFVPATQSHHLLAGLDTFALLVPHMSSFALLGTIVRSQQVFPLSALMGLLALIIQRIEHLLKVHAFVADLASIRLLLLHPLRAFPAMQVTYAR